MKKRCRLFLTSKKPEVFWNSKKLKAFSSSKKAIAIWLSWVLLMAFMVALSAFMYNWITTYTESSAEEIEITDMEESCSSVAIEVSGCQEAETLNIELSNKGNLRIDQVVFRLYDIYNNIESKEKEIKVKAGKTKEIKLLKQGTIQMLESIPVLVKDNKKTLCRDKMYTLENITIC